MSRDFPPSTPKNAEDVKVGPIPLPLLVPLCIFAPFFVTFICFVLYRYTVKRYRSRSALLEQGFELQNSSKEVERQVRDFCHRVTMRRGERESTV